MSSALVWLRRDVRLHDHRALAEATRRHDRVAVAFVYDTQILDALPSRADRRLEFIQASLTEVDQGLKQAGSGLVALHGDPVQEIPRLAAELGVHQVWASHDDDPYAQKRDEAVAKALPVPFQTVKDHVVFERQEVMNQTGQPFRVYTPYMKAWRARFTLEDAAEATPDLGRLWPVCDLPAATGNLSLAEIGFQPEGLWLEPGFTAGQSRLESFTQRLADYGAHRDFPDVDGTSGLSVHLRHGTVSIRECVRAAIEHPSPGAEKWWNELIWREFYHMILANFPHVCGRPFQAQYDGLVWPGDPDHLELWKQGRTGYPIVDAAMRCLKQTGWMHNRLRMVVASFLTKDLLLDWRLGEAWFAEKLLDFELASNNGGWQWAASTGVDAQPYFRVFNPVLQSRKFDPGAGFICRWVPELAGFPEDQVHWPHEATLMEQLAAGCEIGRDYPAPVVDHHVQKEAAVRLLSKSPG